MTAFFRLLTGICAFILFAVLAAPLLAADTAVTSSLLDHIEIIPNDRPTRVEVGTDQQFVATGLTKENVPITGLTFTWSVGGGIGQIGAAGIFTATKASTGTVTATNGTTAATVGVVVKKAATPPGTTSTTPAAPAAPLKTRDTSTNSTPSTNAAPEKTNASEETAAPTAEEEVAKDGTKVCTALRTWVWILILLLYVVLTMIFYLSLGESRSPWWWIWPTVLTVELLLLYWVLRCGAAQDWIPWVTVLLGALFAVFYYRLLRPRPEQGLPPSRPA